MMAQLHFKGELSQECRREIMAAVELAFSTIDPDHRTEKCYFDLTVIGPAKPITPTGVVR